jgi:hypothetical protein
VLSKAISKSAKNFDAVDRQRFVRELEADITFFLLEHTRTVAHAAAALSCRLIQFAGRGGDSIPR